MQVLVKYLGGLNLVTRVEQELIQPRDNTLGSVLLELANRNGKEFQQEIFNPGTNTLKDFITIVLNGRVIPHDALPTTSVVDGDVIAWLPPLLGG